MTYIVILSYAKDLNTQTNTFQILHFVQNDTLNSYKNYANKTLRKEQQPQGSRTHC